jgi:hypothetical protein
MRLGTTLVVAGALLLAPGLARAAVVEVAAGDGGERALRYSDDIGDANHPIVSYDRPSQQFRVRDTGASLLTAGDGCTSVDVQTVTCDGRGVTTMTLDGGAGDDAIDDNVPPIPGSSVRWAEIDGGDGADELLGSDIDEAFDGGPGGDYLAGDGGQDSVTEGEVDADGNGVRVTLDAQPNDGLPDEGDNIRGSIEYIIGGPAADMLSGNNGNHHLYGAGGNDRIFGKGGKDELVGGDGVDALSGGAGRDRISSPEPSGGQTTGDSVDCGSGWDEAIGDAQDRYSINCEQYVFGGVSHFHPATSGSGRPPGLPAIVAPSVIKRKRRLLVIVGCRETASCAGRIRITGLVRLHRTGAARSRTLARGKFRARAGQDKLVKLKLTRKTRKLAARARRGTAYVVAFGEHGGGTVTRRRVRLR